MVFAKAGAVFLLATVSMLQAGTAWESGPFFVAHPGMEGTCYRVKSPGWAAEFRRDNVLLTHQGVSVAIRFLHARNGVAPKAKQPLQGRAHFFIGNSPFSWRTRVSVYREVVYRNLYPGIDLLYGGSGGRLKSEFHIAPGADASLIRLLYTGARALHVDEHGALIAITAKGVFREEPPLLYQRISGRKQRIDGAFAIAGANEAVFQIGPYDHAHALVIDPVIGSSTYLGGSSIDAATSVAVDGSGNIYVAGWTESTDFPSSHSLARGGSVDAFVAKWSAAGVMQYCTYLGGSGTDKALGIAVDSAGNAYVTGSTSSTDFPIMSPLQTTLAGTQNAFLAKLSSSGALAYSTYLGGSGADSGNAIAADNAGNATIAGDTTSSNFPVRNPAQSTRHGQNDVFIARINTVGIGLIFSTYLGGCGDDHATALALDNTGAVYLTGNTTSPDFPTVNPFQRTIGGGQDAFVAKLSSTGAGLLYSTYLGGKGGSMGLIETGSGIAIDTSGNAYVVGTTSSTNFPLVNPMQCFFTGNETDVFVAKVNPSGNGLIYSTYLGGSSFNYGTAIAVDKAGDAWITGYTASTDFPVINPIQSSSGGGYDAFVAEVNPPGTGLTMSTYLGGSGSDIANAIAIDAYGSAYIAGQTLSTNFPAKNATQPVSGGSFDAFVTRIAPPPNYISNLDSATCTSIAGWAWNTTSPYSTVSVDILDGSLLLGTIASGNYRGDLLHAGIGNGMHGFIFPTPASLLNGQPHTVWARISQTTINLYSAPRSLTCGSDPPPPPPPSSASIGILDQATCGTISGWAWDPNNPNGSLNVDILNGTALLITVPASTFRRDLQKAGYGNGIHGFSLPTPLSLADGKTHSITARISQTNIMLYEAPRSFTCAP